MVWFWTDCFSTLPDAAITMTVAGWCDHPMERDRSSRCCGEKIVVRNCVFANGAAGAVEIGGNAGVFVNNLVVNCLGISMLALRNSGPEAPMHRQPQYVRFRPRRTPTRLAVPAATAPSACAPTARRRLPTMCFVGCGNAAVACFGDVNQIAIDRNMFFGTAARTSCAAEFWVRKPSITEGYAAELEDVGLRSAAGNVVGDPQFTGLPAAWLDAYTTDTAATYKTPAARGTEHICERAAGLGDLPSTLDSDAQRPIMRRLTPAEVLAIAVGASQGSHPIDLSTPDSYTERKPEPTLPGDRLVATPPGRSGSRGHARSGAGRGGGSIRTNRSSRTSRRRTPCRPLRAGTDNSAWWALAPRYGLVHHQTEDAARYQRGLDVESTYLVRGTYRTDVAPDGRQSVTSCHRQHCNPCLISILSRSRVRPAAIGLFGLDRLVVTAAARRRSATLSRRWRRPPRATAF
jgi:hypothetical protein